jgi:aryl-alcohol dehydrogenase-like predicted oxidoreductase
MNKPINKIGFGAWQLGNQEWGNMTFDDGIKLVQKAVEKGVNFFDTAPNYGSGNSEKILGIALKEMRNRVFINTKVGHLPTGETSFTSDGIKTSIHHSLKQLQTNYLDSAILHNPPHYILEGKTDAFDTMKSLKEAGLIHHYGVSIDTIDELRTTLENTDVDVIEIMFNMIHQSPRELFEEVKERGIILIIKIPLDSGWLSGKYHHDSTFTGIRSRWSKEDIKQRADIVDTLKTIVGEEHFVQKALAYVLSFDAVSVIIPGIKNVDQLSSNLAANNITLSKKQIDSINKLYDTSIKKQNIPW